MNGFLFLFLTISLVVMLQIQSGVLESLSIPKNSTPTTSMYPKTPMITTTTMTTTSTTTMHHPASTDTVKTILSTTLTTKKKPSKGGAPALSDMGVGSFFLFLINILIHLLYLS